MRKGKKLKRITFMKRIIILMKLLLFCLRSHQIIALISAYCILPFASQGFDFMLAILKLLLLTYWLVTNTKSAALVLITFK